MTPIQLQSDHLEADVLPLGAALARLRLRDTGRDLVLGFADPNALGSVPIFAGVLAGPVANRVAGGLVRIDGQTHQMELNENGVTALHSGSDGLHAHMWSEVARSASHVVLKTELADGQCGLPGDRRFEVCYHLKDYTLTIDITATTSRATPINIAAHPYWHLDEEEDVAHHRLCVHADRYTPTDAQNIPTGEIAPVDDSRFEFKALRPVSLTSALDINFCLAQTPQAVPRTAAVLTGRDGVEVTIATTAPGLQVYNGAHLPDLPHVLHAGASLRPYAGIALEPQFWPDAPNRPNFPQITLDPSQTWRQTSTYTIRQSVQGHGGRNGR